MSKKAKAPAPAPAKPPAPLCEKCGSPLDDEFRCRSEACMYKGMPRYRHPAGCKCNVGHVSQWEPPTIPTAYVNEG